MNLKYTTFYNDNFVNTVADAQSIYSEGNKIAFVNVKGIKGLADNAFSTYKQAQAFADQLAQQYPSKNIFINILNTEVAESDDIDF